jgi:leucyl-tRNA synthetase
MAGSVFDADWPGWDDALTVEPEIEVPVQVNGRTRSRVRVPRGAPEQVVVAAALRDPAVSRFTGAESPAKVVYVKDRLLNFVVKAG